MTEHKKITLKKVADDGHRSGSSTGWKKKVTIPPAGRHVPHPAARSAGRPKKKSSGKGIVLAIFLGLVGCGAIYGIYKYAEMKRIEARREAFALAGHRSACDSHFAQIPPLIADAEEELEKARTMLSEVKEAVQFVTGAPLAAPRKNKPKSDAPGVAVAQPPSAPARPSRRAAPPPPPDPAVSREAGHEEVGGRDAPEGIMSLAELRAMRDKKDAPPEAEPAPAPAAPEAPAAEPAPPPAPTPRSREIKPRVVVIGQQMLGWQDDLAAKLADMRAREAEADELRDDAYRAGYSLEAAKRSEAILKLVASVENQNGYVTAVVQEMQKGTDEVLAIRERVDGERQARAEEERRRQREQEHKQLVAREQAKAIELHKGVVGLLQKYRFTEALAELDFANRSYKTDEGKVALAVYRDRCKRLVEMKSELIRCLNERPFHWGWGLGTVTKDVQGADARVVRVKGETIAWEDVSIQQMKKFLDHYSKNQSEKISWRATMLLGTAILLHEHDQTVDAGIYFREATRLGAFLRDDAERILADYR